MHSQGVKGEAGTVIPCLGREGTIFIHMWLWVSVILRMPSCKFTMHLGGIVSGEA